MAPGTQINKSDALARISSVPWSVCSGRSKKQNHPHFEFPRIHNPTFLHFEMRSQGPLFSSFLVMHVGREHLYILFIPGRLQDKYSKKRRDFLITTRAT
jgi:hypothetical protein